eukprot:11984495-Alexandrium_andersonii.AAC.1
MSASLVGSEMCIRDSLLPAARGQTRPDRALTILKKASPQVHSTNRARICLLYTSDAADDM